MLNVKMTSEMFDRNINSLEAAISLVEKRIAETHSGIDKFMLESFIVETNELISVLKAAKPETNNITVFNYATQPEG